MQAALRSGSETPLQAEVEVEVTEAVSSNLNLAFEIPTLQIPESSLKGVTKAN